MAAQNTPSYPVSTQPIPFTWVNPSSSVANVTTMVSMFHNASTFNNGCPTNDNSKPMNSGAATKWNVSAVSSYTNFGTNSNLYPANTAGNIDPFGTT
jgi:hypothetical protein